MTPHRSVNPARDLTTRVTSAPANKPAPTQPETAEATPEQVDLQEIPATRSAEPPSRNRGAPKPPVRGPERRRHRGNRAAYLYVAPALTLVVGVMYFGVGYLGWLSTVKWDGLSPNRVGVGADNFIKIWHDPIFWATLQHSLIFAVVTISVQMALGLLAAVLLTRRVHFKRLYGLLLFIPVILAPAVMSTVFRELFSYEGQFNGVLRSIGLGSLSHEWLADPHTALYTLAAVNIWQWTGFSFLLYQAALSLIDEQVYEAARLDGAGWLRTLLSVTVPMLRSTHVTLIILGCVGVLKTFDIVWLITGGGPGGSTELLTTYIYKQGVLDFHAGYSAALSVVLLALALGVTVVQMRAFRFGKQT